MKIAIIGTEYLMEKINDILVKEYKDLEIIKYPVDKISNTEKVFNDIDEDVEGVIFTGVGLYSEAIKNGGCRIPCVYPGVNILSVIQSFYEIRKDFDDLSQLKIGLDTLDEQDFIDFIEAFDVEVGDYNIQEYIYPKKEEEFIDKYIEDFNSGKINCVLTASSYIYKYFKEKKLPVYRLKANKMEIKDKYLDLKNEIEKQELNDKATFVKIFEIKEENYSFINKKDKEKIREDLSEYAKGIEGMFKEISKDEYMILSSRKSTKNMVNLNQLYNIIKIYENMGIYLAVGIGEGETLYQAEENSRNAIRRSKLDKGSSIFFYDGNRVVGPILEDNQIEYSTDVNNEYQELVDEVGISYQYIEKIIGAKNKLGRDEFTSKELAKLLLISERTANRLLKKIIENGYGEEVGKEVSLGVARPRRKIKLLF